MYADFFDAFQAQLKKFIEDQVDAQMKSHTRKMDDLVQELQTHRYANYAVHEKLSQLEKINYELVAQVDILQADRKIQDGRIAALERRVGIPPAFPADIEHQTNFIASKAKS